MSHIIENYIIRSLKQNNTFHYAYNNNRLGRTGTLDWLGRAPGVILQQPRHFRASRAVPPLFDSPRARSQWPCPEGNNISMFCILVIHYYIQIYFIFCFWLQHWNSTIQDRVEATSWRKIGSEAITETRDFVKEATCLSDKVIDHLLTHQLKVSYGRESRISRRRCRWSFIFSFYTDESFKEASGELSPEWK